VNHVILDCGCSVNMDNNREFTNNIWVGQKGFCGQHGIIKIKEIIIKDQIAKT